MAITVVGTPTDANGSSTAPAITLPAGIEADDYIILFLKTYDNTTPSAVPSGYTEICAELTVAGRSQLTKAYYKKADGTEDSATLTWTTANTPWVTGQIVLRGVDTATPFDVTVAHATHHTGGTNDPAPQTAGLTTVTDGAVLIEITSITHGQSTSVSSDAVGATEWMNVIATDRNVLATYEEITTAQAVTGAIHTYVDGASSNEWQALIFAMRPAAAGGGTRPQGPLGHPFFGPFGGPIQ